MMPLHGLFEQPQGPIPSLPDVVLRLYQISDDTPRREVLAVMRSDAELCDAVLSVAELPYYSGRRPLRSLSRLVDRIGLPGVRGLLLRTALDRVVFTAASPVMESLRDHSLATAYISQAIGQYAAVHSETAFTCALLQHTGVAVPLGLMITSTGSPPGASLVWETLGCAHEAIAGLIAESWQLPEGIRSVLVRHHRLDSTPETNRIIATLILSDLIASALDRGLGAEEHPPPTAPHVDDALACLDLSPCRLPLIERAAAEVLSRAAA
jgi:HD-like signal output (HDOD) protein